MTRFLVPLAQRRTYLETLDLLLDLAVGVLWFTVFTTLIATSFTGMNAISISSVLACARNSRSKVGCPVVAGARIPKRPRAMPTASRPKC